MLFNTNTNSLTDIFLAPFYPPPDEVGAGGIGIASDVRPSGCPAVHPSRVRMSAFRFRSRTSVTRAWISLIFDTHIP